MGKSSEKEKSSYLAVTSRMAALLLEKSFQNIFELIILCDHFSGAYSGLHGQLCCICDSSNIDNTYLGRGCVCVSSFMSPPISNIYYESVNLIFNRTPLPHILYAHYHKNRRCQAGIIPLCIWKVTYFFKKIISSCMLICTLHLAN